MARQTKCPGCGVLFAKTKYSMHLKEQHNSIFENLVIEIKNKLLEKDEIKVISEKFGVGINFIKKIYSEQQLNSKVSEGNSEYKVNYKRNKMEPENFSLETNTVWSFPGRGNWATHDAKYRGNWSPYIPRNLILRYSKENDVVLDQFIGGGTTLVETKLLNRKGIGVDINSNALEITKRHLDFEYKNAGETHLYKGDARHLDFIPNDYVDFICTHPPYANIIEYSEDIKGDLSHCKVPEFIEQMKAVASESCRVLKRDKFCAILMGDTRQKGHMIPMSFEVMRVFEDAGFKLKELIIKEQHNCKATGYWKTNSIKYNFLLIAHEYLFVMKKM